MADLPSGSGLGSSGAFAVGLIHALSQSRHENLTNMQMAELAYVIERNKLQRSIGKQDQYSAAYGGPRQYRMDKDGTVHNTPVTRIHALEDKLMLIYTSRVRDSEPILSKVKMAESQLKEIKRIGEDSLDAILDHDWKMYGELMHEHWTVKRTITPSMTTNIIDKLYKRCRIMGAYGGKLIGAGGGGFLLLVVPSKEVEKEIIRYVNNGVFKNVSFKFTFNGTEVIQW